MAAFAAPAFAIYFWWAERWAVQIIFAAAVSLTIAALIVLVSRRLLVATVLVAAMLAMVHAISYVKQQDTELVLHAYDLVSFLSSWSHPLSLWQHHRGYAASLVIALSATAILSWIAYRIDGTRIPRVYAAGATAIFVGLACIGAAAKGERRHTELYFESYYVSFFFSSWSETIEALWRGHLIEAADYAPGPRLSVPARCEVASKPPNIILIHQESVVPPSHFPTLSYDAGLDPFFQSFDGKLHKLRVETYGGASWLTEFAVLAGLSTNSFGGMRQVVQPLMAGKMRDTLPQALARCGYRSIAFYPMLRRYLASATFLEAVGFAEIFDAKDQGAKLPNERDRFYYSSALAEMERHFTTSRRPLFTYVETMATHGPYDYAYQPEANVPGGGPGTTPEMHEYLRRLAMAHMDYAFLRRELARRFPGQQFLIVHYGDHQPLATRPLLGFGEEAWIEDVMRSGNDAALLTYYAVDALGYRPPPLPELDIVDVPYLGTLVLEAARLPLSDAYRERVRLMKLCTGRYHGCAQRNEILKFHRRLIDSGLLDAR